VHLDALFTDTVDWDLIRTHWPDMLRVAVSIRAGWITASTILRRLGTYSRKNRLYLAFRELGRVVRTGFLLRYLADTELRATIQAATNKSEQLNRFLKWVFFGGEGIITENSRDEQRKVIKYNHLVANCLIFHNVCGLTHVLSQLQDAEEDVPEAALAHISPYLTEHINRFGDLPTHSRSGLDQRQPLSSGPFSGESLPYLLNALTLHAKNLPPNGNIRAHAQLGRYFGLGKVNPYAC
jgi:hypothetical protein